MASKDSNTHIHGFAGKWRYVIYLRLESGLMPLNWQVKEISKLNTPMISFAVQI
jgi:hypothetical protein